MDHLWEIKRDSQFSIKMLSFDLTGTGEAAKGERRSGGGGSEKSRENVGILEKQVTGQYFLPEGVIFRFPCERMVPAGFRVSPLPLYPRPGRSGDSGGGTGIPAGTGHHFQIAATPTLPS
jgi:hypothetical protein